MERVSKEKESMKKLHEISQVTFSDTRMFMMVDGKRYSWETKAISDRLARARKFERERYEVSPSGYGLHWPLVDEDLSVDGLLKTAKLQKPAYDVKSSDRHELVVAERRARYTTRRGDGSRCVHSTGKGRACRPDRRHG
jgi:hypothetical protein